MSKEFNSVETSAEIIENVTTGEQSLTQLNELSLTLVGGGGGAVIY
jgi:hypothetical protein